jgi:hypothetical protein
MAHRRGSGTSGHSRAIGSGSSETTAAALRMGDERLNGLRLVSSSYNTAPSEN